MAAAYRGARYCAAMRTRGRALPFAAAIAAALATMVSGVALATTSEQLQTLAESKVMTCTVNPGDITCTGSGRLNQGWLAVINPATGQFMKLTTSAYPPANGGPLDAAARTFMSDMHGLACGDQKGVTAFVGRVGDLPAPGFVKQQQVGDCLMDGQLTPPGAIPNRYIVVSTYSPLPTPSPTPKPTAPPTKPPTPSPTVAATTATTAIPSESPSASPSETPTASPSPSPSPTGVVSPAEASPVPTSTPGPTPPVGGGGGGCKGPGCGSSSFVDAIPSFDGVATDATNLGGSGL